MCGTRSQFGAYMHKWKKWFESACVLVTKSCRSLFLWLVLISELMLNQNSTETTAFCRRCCCCCHRLQVDFNYYANSPCSHFDGSKRYIRIANDMLYFMIAILVYVECMLFTRMEFDVSICVLAVLLKIFSIVSVCHLPMMTMQDRRVEWRKTS